MLILGNGRVVTRNPECPYMEEGAVAIDGKVICKVGPTDELKKAYPDAEFIDAKGGVIMPAFINTHEHIYSSFARGLAINGYNPTGLLSILEGMWWTLDRNLTLNDTYLSAMATYIDSIKNGVTTVFDHHASFGAIKGSLFEIERAAKETGIRSCPPRRPDPDDDYSGVRNPAPVVASSDDEKRPACPRRRTNEKE